MAPMQFSLRTLLIVLAIAPPVLACAWWAWQHHPMLILYCAIATGRVLAEIAHERDKYLPYRTTGSRGER